MPAVRRRPAICLRTFIVRHRGARRAIRIEAPSAREAARHYCTLVELDVEDEVITELLRDDGASWMVDTFYPQELERGRVGIPRLS